MNKDELRSRVESITSPTLQREELYELLETLNIPYKKTRCTKCLQDYLLILKEEAGVIDSAAESSSFNTNEDIKQYKYIRNRTVLWNRDGKYVKINQNTPTNIIEEFIKTHRGFYKEINNTQND